MIPSVPLSQLCSFSKGGFTKGGDHGGQWGGGEIVVKSSPGTVSSCVDVCVLLFFPACIRRQKE